MASEKNSRLINLVIALLATKKFLTKPQIFKAVAGYEGNAEATDRMFERDKEELRALGIEIEIRAIDPLFEDDIGYRLRPERYRLDLGP
jgi:proteasome accessory factor B